MEEKVREIFKITAPDLRQVPVLTLAYVGDSAYDLILRTYFAETTTLHGKPLHDLVQKYVTAKSQARAADGLQEELTEEETAVFRRGKNARPETVTKHASAAEYYKATGLEALIGYLYLSGRTARAAELVRKGMAYAEAKTGE
ncbi:MAG: ribonuclease III [Lachnospiraceae bacterium]|nr:ribonuclease III [Lachnospiraceae bacterium]